MCDHEGRGDRGRWTKGQSGNPRGRKPLSPAAKLVEAAREVGASIIIALPAEAASDGLPPLPPGAA